MNNKNLKQLNICFHGYTFGYCPRLCLRFNSLKEKIAEDRRLFLKEFNQTPKTLEQLLKRKSRRKMNIETKTTLIKRLINYRELEKQAPY